MRVSSYLNPRRNQLATLAKLFALFSCALVSTPIFCAEFIYPRLFVGGVSGIDALATPGNSDQYRADGGGIYLHTSGWAPLSAAVKDEIQATFAGQDYAVEIGFSATDPSSWVSRYLIDYHNRGIRPAFITCNAFSSGDVPTPTQWSNFVTAFRNAGIDNRTRILPTFEYQNFSQNISTLSSNKVSLRADFQQIITTSAGIVLDTPSSYFFEREPAYRVWVVDAIQWTRSQGFSAVVIISPHNASTQYDEKTALYVDYLKTHDALPNMFAVENYSTEDPATYPNIVGSEDVAHQQLGCARRLQTTWLPAAVGRSNNDYDGDGSIARDVASSGRSNYDVRDFGFEFDSTGDLEGWTQSANVSGLTTSGGTLKGLSTSPDPSIWKTGLFFDGGHIGTLHVRIKSSVAQAVQIFWSKDNGGFNAVQSVTIAIPTPNTWHVLNFSMSSSTAWHNQNITALRLDPSPAAGASFEVDYIRGSNEMTTPLGAVIHVDQAYTGTTPRGTATDPFRTVMDGNNAAEYGDTIRIRVGSYREVLTLGTNNKALRLEATNGTAIIGR